MSNNNIIKDLISKIDDVNAFVKSVPGLIGSLVLIIEPLKKNPIAFYCGLALIVITLVWFIIKRVIDKFSPRKPTIKVDESKKTSAYIRGILPFEKRDKLLGRDDEQKEINTIINSSNFNFGYVSGDAGSGKTSFIRSIVLLEAEESGFLPLNIKSISGNPVKTINNEISKILNGDILNNEFERNIQLLSEKQNKPIIIIIDQFEEFFIAIKSIEERKAIIKKLTSISNGHSREVKILLSIRKEFVDDLQEFSPEIDQPTDRRFALRLRNWDTALAKTILNKIIEIDSLRFSDQLCFELINDLSREGYVRPVEFQIVAKSLLDAKIYDYESYLSKGKSDGILGSYIKEIIEPKDGIAVPELEKQIIRSILKILCDEKNNTKRGIGLTQPELYNLVKNTINSSAQRNLIMNDQDFDQYFAIALKKLFKEYIIKYDDDQKINLIHDYIVSAIRVATADIETSEEQANRLLNKYLEDQKTIAKTTIPRKHYTFIKQNASHELKKTDSSIKLLKRTKHHTQFYNSLPALLILIFATAIWPPRIKEVKHIIYSANNITWTSNPSGNVLIAKTEDSLLIWQMGKELKLTNIFLNVTFVDISNTGNWLLISDTLHTYIYQNDHDTNFTQRFIINELPGSAWSSFGFVENKNLFYLVSKKGNIYLFNLNKENKNIKPLFSFDSNSTSKYTYVWTSPQSNFLFGEKSHNKDDYLKKDLFYIPLDSPQTSDLFFLIHDVSDFDFSYKLSQNDSLIAYTMNGKFFLQEFKCQSTKIDFQSKNLVLSDDTTDSNTGLYFFEFSSNCHWLFARTLRGFTKAINLKNKTVYDLDNPNDNNSYISTSYNFSRDGKYCSFKDRNNYLYLIKLDDIYRNNIPFKPILKNVEENEEIGLRQAISSRVSFNPSNKAVLGNNISGYVYYWKIGTSPNLKKPIVYFDNYHSLEMIWSKTGDFAYTFSNNRIYYGNPSKELNQVTIKIDSKIQDVYTSRDSSSLIILTKNELITVKKELYLWDLIPVKKYYWPEIHK